MLLIYGPLSNFLSAIFHSLSMYNQFYSILQSKVSCEQVSSKLFIINIYSIFLNLDSTYF